MRWRTEDPIGAIALRIEKSSRRCAVAAIAASLTLLATASGAAAATGITIAEPIPGQLEVSPDGVLQERFIVPITVLDRLATIPQGTPVTIEGWPVAPGERRSITVERHQVVDRAAPRLLVSPSGTVPLPASSRVHLWGHVAGDDGRILLSLDPTARSLRGFVVAGGTVHDLAPSGGDHLVVPAAERLAAKGWTIQPWACSAEDEALEAPAELPVRGEPAPPDAPELAALSASIAFDTDTEFMQLKFGNDQAAALDYIADLVAAMNVMYERDLDVTLLQGETILRVGSDPYNQNSGGAASSAELSEFSSYWAAHYSGIDRALAAMLSGKSPSPYSASGIAWLGGLCSHSYGYSFTKVFQIDYLAGDAFVVGHELGHNFGSRHTHCYVPPIDECYAGESGCYQGPTSCPGGPGTVMSYCHLNGCGNNLMEFHSRVIANILTNYLPPAVGVCIFPAGGEELFSDGFESGTTGAWSATNP